MLALHWELDVGILSALAFCATDINTQINELRLLSSNKFTWMEILIHFNRTTPIWNILDSSLQSVPMSVFGSDLERPFFFKLKEASGPTRQADTPSCEIAEPYPHTTRPKPTNQQQLQRNQTGDPTDPCQ